MSIDLGVPGCWITEKEERNERNTFGSNTLFKDYVARKSFYRQFDTDD